MAYYQIFSGENDKIRGTDDDDTVLGPAGGTDQIDTRGGDDVVTIYQRAIYSILATPIGDFLDQYLGLADPFTGTIDGGEGVDTLVARIIPKAGVRILDPYDLSKAIVRDVEILRTEDPVALTIAQTAWFQFLRGYSTQLYIELVGEGGALDLSIKSDEALVSEVDGAALTSALRYVGTHRSDIVTGSAFGDVLFGGSGDDEVRWLGGVDYLSGGSGRDTLTIIWSETTRLDFDGSTYSGTLANGTKYVGFEQFKVRGGDGDDEITGGGGSDRLTGGNGSNVIRGLGGDDIIGLDFGYYDDTDLQLLTFHPGKDRLYGDGGNDMIHASGNDFVDGGTGDDELSSSFGGNRLFGGSGNDRLSSSGTTQSFQPPVVVDELFGESGNDQISLGSPLATGHGGSGNDRISVTLYGQYAETDLRLYGDSGSDILIGGRWNEFLGGGSGADQMTGGHGDDTYVVDNRLDVVVELAGQGTDRVEAAISYILTEHVENLALSGAGNINGWGNAEGNVLTGNSGNNRLNGLAGADTMIGGLGDDTYIVDNAGDTLVEFASEGFDVVQSNGSVTLSTHFERLELMGKANVNAVGTDSANYLLGNDGNNVLTGKGGLDALEGGGGADTFRYLALSDSNAVTGMDRIVDFDFAEGDRVNVSAIDADAGLAGNQAFDTLIGADVAFTEAGQFRFSKAGNFFLAEFNVNGDPTAELTIRFQGTEPPEETWFIL